MAIPKPNILLVEDEPIAMMANCKLLAQIGYTPDTAETGEKALKMALAEDYDIIFMDIGLPDTDGIQVTQKIRQNENPHKPACIIALTAYIEDEKLRDKCIAVGMNDIAGKPISSSKLQSLINKYTVNT